PGRNRLSALGAVRARRVLRAGRSPALLDRDLGALGPEPHPRAAPRVARAPARRRKPTARRSVVTEGSLERREPTERIVTRLRTGNLAAPVVLAGLLLFAV